MSKKPPQKLTEEEMLIRIEEMIHAADDFTSAMERFNSIFPPKTSFQKESDRNEALKTILIMKEKIKSLVKDHGFTDDELYPRTKRHSKSRISGFKARN